MKPAAGLSEEDRLLMLEALALVKEYHPRLKRNVARKNRVLLALSKRVMDPAAGGRKPGLFEWIRGKRKNPKK